MYKEEGNQWIKRKTPKDIREAFNCYAVGIGHGDKALSEDRVADIDQIYPIMSTLYGNRAMCSLQLKNYRAAYVDSCKALQFNCSNIKAHYRKCKALQGSKRYEDCTAACDEALRIDPTNAEVVQIKEKCLTEIARRESIVAKRTAERVALCSELEASWLIASQRHATLGSPHPTHPLQFENKIYPSYQQVVMEEKAGTEVEVTTDCWPMLCLYPQYNQIDVLHAVAGDELLVIVMSQMFAEPGDHQTAPWDIYKEFYLSKLVVYIPINGNKTCQDREAWIDRMCTRILNEKEKKQNTEAEAVAPAMWTEVHMGCTIAQILAVPNHVLDGGLLTCTVFVR